MTITTENPATETSTLAAAVDELAAAGGVEDVAATLIAAGVRDALRMDGEHCPIALYLAAKLGLPPGWVRAEEETITYDGCAHPVPTPVILRVFMDVWDGTTGWPEMAADEPFVCDEPGCCG